MTNVRAYSLCGVPIRVECQTARQDSDIRLLWQRLFFLREKTSSGRPASVFLHLQSTGQAPGRPWNGDVVFESSALRVLKTEDGFRLECASSALDLQLGRSRGAGILDATFWETPVPHQRDFFLLAFLMLLRRHGMYGLHASAATIDGTGCLIVGPSGCGKTTLTLALLRQGWRYLSDDALLLRAGSRGVEALAFRRGFSCTPDTAAHFPELGLSGGRRAGSNDGKAFVDIEHIYPGKLAPCCRPRVVVFPKVVTQPRSQLVPVTQTSALTGLIQQSPGILTDPPSVAQQMEVLRLLVEGARSYQLLLGQDALHESAAVSGLLRRAAPFD